MIWIFSTPYIITARNKGLGRLTFHCHARDQFGETTNLVHLTADQDTYWLLSCQLSSKGHLCGVVPWSEFIAGVSQAEVLCNPSLHIRYSPNLSPSLQSQTGSIGCHTCSHEQLHTKREPSPQVKANAMVEVFVIRDSQVQA